ncbi:MAG: dTMP kinase [Gammaproteobacteria bacterium]|nr:dTMP kinase [Gammaproteobacteria bacterium]MDH5630609.1 dTMP kinase [Gammaproteobacteria bacterium]
MKSSKGKFITLEGTEGVGKSTCMSFVKEYLESKGIQTWLTREPGGTPLAEDLRKLLLTNREETVENKTELLMMFAARCQHVNQVIKPALDAGKWVICDRYVDASYAYQGGGRGISFEEIRTIEQWCFGDFKTDLTILLDMPVEIAMKRARKRSSPDRIESEKIDFFERIRTAYMQRANDEPDRIYVVDAEPSIGIVQKNIKSILEKYI